VGKLFVCMGGHSAMVNHSQGRDLGLVCCEVKINTIVDIYIYLLCYVWYLRLRVVGEPPV